MTNEQIEKAARNRDFDALAKSLYSETLDLIEQVLHRHTVAILKEIEASIERRKGQ